MPRFNFTDILLTSKADIRDIQSNFEKIEELGITAAEVQTLITALNNAKLNKSGDTMSGNLGMQNNKMSFSNSGNIEWKENGYGDKFRIIPDFNGSDDSNKLIVQSTIGGAGTDPDNWKDLFYIKADTGEIVTLGLIKLGNKQITSLATRNYSYGTSAPTGGSDGDIYDQYFN